MTSERERLYLETVERVARQRADFDAGALAGDALASYEHDVASTRERAGVFQAALRRTCLHGEEPGVRALCLELLPDDVELALELLERGARGPDTEAALHRLVAHPLDDGQRDRVFAAVFSWGRDPRSVPWEALLQIDPVNAAWAVSATDLSAREIVELLEEHWDRLTDRELILDLLIGVRPDDAERREHANQSPSPLRARALPLIDDDARVELVLHATRAPPVVRFDIGALLHGDQRDVSMLLATAALDDPRFVHRAHAIMRRVRLSPRSKPREPAGWFIQLARSRAPRETFEELRRWYQSATLTERERFALLYGALGRIELRKEAARMAVEDGRPGALWAVIERALGDPPFEELLPAVLAAPAEVLQSAVETFELDAPEGLVPRLLALRRDRSRTG